MSEAYAREILRRNVAQICQTIGWNGINSTPLDILVHVLEKYIRTLSTQANRHAEQFNRTEPNLHDLGLVFRDLHIHLPELTEYVRSVPPVPPPVSVERFPKLKESNLNFLKPGSHEVVTRPVHVHEHLPPMYPEKERDTPAVAGTVEIQQNGIDNAETSTASCASPEISVTDSPEKKDIFKRPIDPVSIPNSKRPRLRLDEEERTREISSVMMTMSGFLSPAREGKLPEARPPTMISDRHYDKHKVNSHSGAVKAPIVDKSDKKSKKSKLLNGKVTKSKRRDKSHKGESSKSKDSAKLNKYPPGYPMKSKEVHPTHHNHVTMPAPRPLIPTSVSPRPILPPPLQTPIPELIQPVIKQEPIELPSLPPPPPPLVTKTRVSGEDTIPVPRKIPISKSPLISNSIPVHKQSNSLIPDLEIIKKEVEEEKLASQPDRSKINIFKRISNKAKEDRNAPEVVPEKLQSDSVISRLHNSLHNSASDSRSHGNFRGKTDEPTFNNNVNSALDMSSVMDLRTNEVISVDDDSLDKSPFPPRHFPEEPRPSLSINKSLQAPFPKDVASVSPKPKKEKKHRDKKDKAAKLEAKLLKKQQQQLAFEMAQAERQKYDSMKMAGVKPPKSSRQKNAAKMPQLPPGFPFFHSMPPGRGLMPGPGLVPNPNMMQGNDFLAGLANNPALRGLPAGASNFLTNPFALGPTGPGLIPGSSYLPGGSSGSRNPLMSNFSPHSSRAMKIPPMLRRPSLEVIPVDNDDDRGHKSVAAASEKGRNEKHKPQTIPNILQKKPKSQKDHKASLYKMPPVHPDITIELNPPREIRREPRRESPAPPPPRSPTPPPEPVLVPEPIRVPALEIKQEKDSDGSEKRKDKSHKKEKKDKDGIKIKKKKDKKDKNKEKTEKKREKDEKHDLKDSKDKIRKDKREKKKDKAADGLVPKLTLKFSSSNSNSPMPPSSPDIFKLNIKPVIKKEDEADSPATRSPAREHSRSPELAQISALVTRPPKQKHSRHNHADSEAHSSPPAPSAETPAEKPRKSRPPSGTKYKRLLFKPMSKKGPVEHFDDDGGSLSDEPAPAPPAPAAAPAAPAAAAPAAPAAAPGAPPAPYYVDEQGNKVWVCPACGRPDNGSPMIGCDGCDGWYHWVCVGITEEPGATEDWFCKSCLNKRAALALAGLAAGRKLLAAGRKRGRKPKGDCR